MAYFEGVGGSGGSIVVTCDSEFAGSTISCSDGTNTMTAVCPSVSPYEVEFMVSDSGTYEISATVSGTTYTTEVVVDLELEATLEYGFSWRRWVTYGGLDPTDYEDLADVFSDAEAVRQLMLVHDSADYLISKVTDDVDTLDDFVVSDTAMKWLGLCDYVCDGIVAVTGAEAKLLGSTYWKRYLKDHVPTMTSNTAPYGTVSLSPAEATTNPAWKAFDGDTSTGAYFAASNSEGSCIVKFTNPINVRIFSLFLSNSIDYTFQVFFSDDGTNYTNAGGTFTYFTSDTGTTKYFRLDSDYGYHLYWKVTRTISLGTFFARELQLYGRFLDVSVPKMTSNTAPYGEVIGNTGLNSVLPYLVFDNDSSTEWESASNTVGSYHGIGYKFTDKVVIKNVFISMATYGKLGNGVIQGSNDGNTWEDVYTIGLSLNANTNYYFTFSNSVPYKYYRVYGQLVSNRVGYKTIQFYGVDYSEKEFETGTTRKWLYDHGVELENIEINDNTTKEDDYISIKGTTTTYYGMIVPTNSIDLTDYSIERVKIGDVMSGNVQIQASSDKTSYNSGRFGYKAVAVGSSDLPNNLYYDVSAVNQNAYPNIVMAQVNSTIDISEWWLE